MIGSYIKLCSLSFAVSQLLWYVHVNGEYKEELLEEERSLLYELFNELI